ncbi:acyltransferase [Winogradskyella litoriviva]|uniref:Acyltransferase n=1 Tax=Winogradskyella litoriviva TaxID=1220182 RepID=A0ABX2E4J2_9FLAO|nr:acyltransferase [Winogradskyella litoriviva]NRD23230.1 acyltransferase [Winogradskyella litoriviva]
MENKLAFIPVITLLRGLAALIVCLFHFVCGTTDYVNNDLILKIFQYGTLGVPMFFVISGIVLPLAMINGNYKTSSWKNFLLKRIIRIEPPYLVAVVLAVVYMYLRSFMSNTGDVDIIPSSQNILLHIGYLVPFFENANWLNAAFWTLAIEFQYYILLVFLFPLMINKNYVYRILFYIILLLPGFIIIKEDFFTHYSSLFLIGILFVLRKAKKINQIEFILMSIITCFVVYYLLGIETLFVVFFTLFIVNYFPKFKQKQFNFLGKISYSLYLLHGLTGTALINVLSHHFKEPFQKVIVIVLGVMFSIMVAYLMYLFVEKPAQFKASLIGYNKKSKK